MEKRMQARERNTATIILADVPFAHVLVLLIAKLANGMNTVWEARCTQGRLAIAGKLAGELECKQTKSFEVILNALMNVHERWCLDSEMQETQLYSHNGVYIHQATLTLT